MEGDSFYRPLFNTPRNNRLQRNSELARQLHQLRIVSPPFSSASAPGSQAAQAFAWWRGLWDGVGSLHADDGAFRLGQFRHAPTVPACMAEKDA